MSAPAQRTHPVRPRNAVAAFALLLTFSAAAPAAGGGLYDIGVLLNEPHPFAAGAAAAAEGPRSVAVPLMQSGAYGRRAATLAPVTGSPVGAAPVRIPQRMPAAGRQPVASAPEANAPSRLSAPAIMAQASGPAPADDAGGMTWPGGDWLNGWYAGLGAGIDFLDDADTTAANGQNAATSRDGGFAGFVTLGAWFGDNLRGEVEYARRLGESDSVTIGGTAFAAGADTIVDSFMVNLVLEPADGPFSPFFGIGIGVALVDGDDIVAGGTRVAGRDDTAGAIQGIGGLRYRLDDAWSAAVEARYLDTADADVTATTVSAHIYRQF